MHRRPPVWRGLVETTLGQRISWRWRRHLYRPLTHQHHLPVPPPCAGGHFGGEHLPRHSPVLQEEELSTYPSSGLCWRDTMMENRPSDLFSGPPRAIMSQRCFVASPVCSHVGAKSHSARSSQERCTDNSLIFWVWCWSRVQLELWPQKVQEEYTPPPSKTHTKYESHNYCKYTCVWKHFFHEVSLPKVVICNVLAKDLCLFSVCHWNYIFKFMEGLAEINWGDVFQPLLF